MLRDVDNWKNSYFITNLFVRKTRSAIQSAILQKKKEMF